MTTIWNTLQIEQCKDKKAIKKAYAKLIKTVRPEDGSEGFEKIHEAYEAALNYASLPEGEDGGYDPEMPTSHTHTREDHADEEFDIYQSFHPLPEPYSEHKTYEHDETYEGGKTHINLFSHYMQEMDDGQVDTSSPEFKEKKDYLEKLQNLLESQNFERQDWSFVFTAKSLYFELGFCEYASEIIFSHIMEEYLENSLQLSEHIDLMTQLYSTLHWEEYTLLADYEEAAWLLSMIESYMQSDDGQEKERILKIIDANNGCIETSDNYDLDKHLDDGVQFQMISIELSMFFTLVIIGYTMQDMALLKEGFISALGFGFVAYWLVNLLVTLASGHNGISGVYGNTKLAGEFLEKACPASILIRYIPYLATGLYLLFFPYETGEWATIITLGVGTVVFACSLFVWLILMGTLELETVTVSAGSPLGKPLYQPAQNGEILNLNYPSKMKMILSAAVIDIFIFVLLCFIGFVLTNSGTLKQTWEAILAFALFYYASHQVILLFLPKKNDYR